MLTARFAITFIAAPVRMTSEFSETEELAGCLTTVYVFAKSPQAAIDVAEQKLRKTRKFRAIAVTDGEQPTRVRVSNIYRVRMTARLFRPSGYTFYRPWKDE